MRLATFQFGVRLKSIVALRMARLILDAPVWVDPIVKSKMRDHGMEKSVDADRKVFWSMDALAPDPNPGCDPTMPALGVVRGRSPAPLLDRKEVRIVRFVEVKRPSGEVGEKADFEMVLPISET